MNLYEEHGGLIRTVIRDFLPDDRLTWSPTLDRDDMWQECALAMLENRRPVWGLSEACSIGSAAVTVCPRAVGRWIQAHRLAEELIELCGYPEGVSRRDLALEFSNGALSPGTFDAVTCAVGMMYTYGVDWHDSPAETNQGRELIHDVWDSVDLLPRSERVVIRLLFERGMTQVEAAALLNRTQPRISQLSRSGIRRLQSRFSDRIRTHDDALAA